MNVLEVLPMGEIDGSLLQHLRGELAHRLGVKCAVLPVSLDPEFAYHAERSQYHSSEILARMQSYLTPQTWRLLAVTKEDLYIPILKFVFGEAQMGGPCAVVSLHRLRQEFYGMPGDEQLLRGRLVKEAVHEAGHTLGLTHCEDYRCAMAPSHGVEWIDLKEGFYCSECSARAPVPVKHFSS